MNRTFLTVEDFILQRDGMKLIDKILMVDDSTAISESIISPAWPLYKNGYVHSIVIIELVAQTAGINIKWSEKTGPSPEDGKGEGFLVGIKKATFTLNHIPVASTVKTCCQKRYNQMGYAEFSGVVTIDDKTIGDVIVQLFRSD